MYVLRAEVEHRNSEFVENWCNLPYYKTVNQGTSSEVGANVTYEYTTM
jgi:hypothetical protein